ncbi:Hypothetical protein mma_0996 [Janthinobacterium sp. Marseille]|uniref:Uncharacterized protein n=1 Tax=Herminiimonas aquatilis TaxID=345342 RepID=A0ABW2J9P6_9BURK|nr:hypothetical protein [Janthinobacterium sp. Marseille]ABR91934.1 Hypothetical protein mma_0996 [Janthinobacterium sp. Marseille]
MSKLAKNDPRAKYEALERQFDKELDALSDANLLKEANEDGLNAAEIANEMRSNAIRLIAESKRKLLIQTRERMETARQISVKKDISRPTLDVMKDKLQRLFAQKPNLAVAFRQGKSQSDSDWAGLWDDLVEMGEIKEDDDDR